ncbi:uncharacterized protein LOC6544873 [Drosophila erecta]|uniref:Chitin-binding type-2 domain-containing protein n=1 Tax=Drosophila erecta TaxID=7220 RepID=A0A0Q5U904_DROER|nr:uncharacterized protein LOC6544873 [Drosophila erecta]KQS44180.1 uncharacterized protein Dere_GG16654 [Drosophila erecta]
MKRTLLIMAIVFCGLAAVKALKCQECLTDNEVYCIDQTSYRNCINSKPFGNVISCPTDTVCTNSKNVCVKSSEIQETIVDVCGAPGGYECASCTTQNYACVSKNQFARCSDSGLVESNIYDCDTDEICSSEALEKFDNICAPSCFLNFLNLKATCSNSEYTTTTTAAPTTVTPSIDQKKAACTKAETDLKIPENTSYFYTIYQGDTSCHTYLYCEKSETSEWDTVYLSCPKTKPYFDSTTSLCVSTKPSGCS